MVPGSGLSQLDIVNNTWYQQMVVLLLQFGLQLLHYYMNVGGNYFRFLNGIHLGSEFISFHHSSFSKGGGGGGGGYRSSSAPTSSTIVTTRYCPSGL